MEYIDSTLMFHMERNTTIFMPKNTWSDQQVIAFTLSRFETRRSAELFAKYWMLAKAEMDT